LSLVNPIYNISPFIKIAVERYGEKILFHQDIVLTGYEKIFPSGHRPDGGMKTGLRPVSNKKPGQILTGPSYCL